MRTLALVKQDIGVTEGVDNVLEEDTLNLEASSLTKDDKDFKVYMGSGGYIGIHKDIQGHFANYLFTIHFHSQAHLTSFPLSL